MASEGEDAVVQVFFIRGGRLIGRDHFYLKIGEGDGAGEILSSFVKQFYAGTPYILSLIHIYMGMMGRLTERDRELIGEVIRGVASGDIGLIQEAVLALGDFRGKPDRNRLYQDISDLMSKYGSADMGTIDIGEVMQDLMDVMKENRISMPHGLTMLARGLTHMEGVLAEITPEINICLLYTSRCV